MQRVAQLGDDLLRMVHVSGGHAGAQNGLLTIMCGGEPLAFEQAQPVLQSFAQAVTLLGGPGSGQLCKMVNQICVAGVVQWLSEAIAFGQAAGLGADTVVAQPSPDGWRLLSSLGFVNVQVVPEVCFYRP